MLCWAVAFGTRENVPPTELFPKLKVGVTAAMMLDVVVEAVNALFTNDVVDPPELFGASALSTILNTDGVETDIAKGDAADWLEVTITKGETVFFSALPSSETLGTSGF